MQIHKGTKYSIYFNGKEAEKHGGNTTLAMRYFTERDVSAIAGEIDEQTAWQIMYDIAKQADSCNTPIAPEHIFIDGNSFHLSEWSESTDYRLTAPEGYSVQWALAASVFYIYLGCHVFQGLGGAGQTPTSPIPTLRRELPELSKLISRCLEFDKNKRPKMNEIIHIAGENLERCKKLRKEFPPLKSAKCAIVNAENMDKYWPDEMY